MKITIITVVFNAADTILDALDSVSKQSHRDVEHIVVDGASTDRTLDIIKRHGSRVAKIISEPDKGIYDAMNKGLRLATGEVIGFLNADDVYEKSDVLECVANNMHRNELDALFGDVVYVNPSNTHRVIRRYSSKNFRPSRIAWGWMPSHPALFFRSSIYKQYGLFREDYKIAGDYEYVARVFKPGNDIKYMYYPGVLVRMRTGGASAASWKNTILLNREVVRACRENGLSTNIAKVMSKYPSKLLELLLKNSK